MWSSVGMIIKQMAGSPSWLSASGRRGQGRGERSTGGAKTLPRLVPLIYEMKWGVRMELGSQGRDKV